MQSKLSSYINGFDWVRALMSVAVVTWHLKTFGTSALFTESFAAHRFGGTRLHAHFVLPARA
jgi:peptidoglycan/LPS O-acetylase OafA/YrhL